jgi:hypothetical protein
MLIHVLSATLKLTFLNKQVDIYHEQFLHAPEVIK